MHHHSCCCTSTLHHALMESKFCQHKAQVRLGLTLFVLSLICNLVSLYYCVPFPEISFKTVLKMFCLFSSLDFIIKLWDLQKKLIAEITLDNTLNTACFLNSSGDILLAFKNDLYLLSHKKILDLPKSRIASSKIAKSGNT